MSINIQLSESIFEDNEKIKLKTLFSAKNDDDFNKIFTNIAEAAIAEYKQMFLGLGLPSRVNEIREFRLYYLIKYYYKSRIPNEFDVSTLFQLPESRSKNLILYVMTRFKYQLESQIKNTVREIIKTAIKKTRDEIVEFILTIDSSNFIDEINRIIKHYGVEYRPLLKIKNEPFKYAIPQDSYDQLIDYLKD